MAQFCRLFSWIFEKIDNSENLKKSPILSKEVNINNFQEKSNAQQKRRNLAKIHENTKIQEISSFQIIWEFSNFLLKIQKHATQSLP